MVLCKFFLQGDCRFGENCKFEHQFSSENLAATGNEIFPNNRNQNKAFSPNKPANEVDTNTLLTSVRNDMLSNERSGQWILTCYAPFKEKPLFSGFNDQSPEEVRLGFYEAHKSNNLEQYKQQLQQSLLEARSKFKALQNPSKEIITILKNIYNNQPDQNVSASNTQNSIFGNKSAFGSVTNSNIFGQNTNQNVGSIFGQNQNPNQVFGQQNKVQNSGSVFGQPAIHQNAGNVFGQPSTPQNSGSVFGQQSAPQNAGSVFGQQSAPQNTGSVFGQQNSPQSIFGKPNAGNIFAQQNTKPANSTGVVGQSGSIFSQNAPQSASIFSQNNAQQNTNSIFANANKSLFSTMNPSQKPQSLFGNPVQQTNLFQQSQPQNLFSSNQAPFTNSAQNSQFGQGNVENVQQLKGNSIFAQAPQQPFANPAAQQLPFANTAPQQPFANTTPQQPFANTAPQQQQQPFANTAPQQQPFANTAPQQQPFAITVPQQQQPFANTAPQQQPFANTAPQQQPFANTAPQQPFANTAPQQPFANTAPQQQQPFANTAPQQQPFANTAPQQPFANTAPQHPSVGSVPQNPQPQNSIFTTQNTQPHDLTVSQKNSVFMQQQNQPDSVFSRLSQPEPAKAIFGNSAEIPRNQPISGNIFGGGSSAINHAAYSKLEELSETDIEWFKSNDLDIHKMPDKPPTYEMCFA